MTKTKTNESTYLGVHLWDEILKAIVSTMPQQLFPLFKEVYGKEYPPGTSIILLPTENSTIRETKDGPPSSKLMDISLLVDGTDYYHLECQMKNDALPDRLRCRLIFQDNSQHIYEIPTVKIQSYPLEEIKEKHLSLFLPYALLRLEPRLKSTKPLTKKELTDFVSSLIVILEDEFREGNLTESQLKDYVLLIREAARRLLNRHPEYYQEVHSMMERKIVLYSDLERALEEKDAALSEKDAALNERDAYIAELEAKLAAYEAKMN